MKKILSNIILFFLIFAILISFTGCQEEEEKKREEPIDYLDVGYYETLEEYEKWLSSNSSFLGNQFPTYQKIAMLGEFVDFSCDPIHSELFDAPPVGYSYRYTLTDKSMQNFDFYFAGEDVSIYKIFSGARTTEDVESINGIQHVKIPSAFAQPRLNIYISYNSIQFKYQYTETDMECMLKTITWECSGLILVLLIEDYPLNVTDTFLGQMLTSFEAAEAGIKALNIAMFEFSDES